MHGCVVLSLSVLQHISMNEFVLYIEDMKLDRYLKIMDLLLKVEPAIFKFTFGDPAVLPSLILLAALFRCCKL